jgi:hypothetical protein
VVTVTFTVTPVPFTDKYEITIEQTFQTHVPLPVLVLSPSYREFDNVTPGFQASYIVTAKNEGLIQMENLTITGDQNSSSSFIPLITYVPVLLPQQTIEIPFTATYWGSNAPGHQGALSDCLPNPSGVGGDIAGFIDGLRALCNAEGRCIKDNSLIILAGGVALGMKLFQDLSSLVAGVAEQVANYIGCVIGTLLGQGLGGGGSASGGGGSTQDFGGGGAPCFTADTQVLLLDGRSETIDRLKTGDLVRSGLTDREFATVLERQKQTSDKCRLIRFTAAGITPAQADAGQTVCATDDHSFWVDGKGWTTALRLRVGDWLLKQDGSRVRITASDRVAGTHDVYTLVLGGDRVFYANGVLVHDACGWLAQANAATGPPPESRRTSVQPSK